MTSGPSPPRVELFVRSLSPSEARNPVDSQLQRLRTLRTNEDVADLSVSVWGREVGLSSTAVRTDAGEFVLERVAAFREWADRRGVSLEPFFESREVRSELTGEEYATLVLPVSCMAEYEDGRLVHVAPHAADDAVCTVADRIDRLEERTRSDTDVERARLATR